MGMLLSVPMIIAGAFIIVAAWRRKAAEPTAPTLWSGFDIRYPPSRGLTKRMSNPKLHQEFIIASGPFDSTFAKVAAEKEREC
jgi:hypothetical protein